MKKALKILGIVLLIGLILLPGIQYLLICVGLNYAVTHNYTDIVWNVDGYDYLIREKNKKAGVCSYTYDPEAGDKVIVIPESYEDYPIQSLGGYIGRGGPCPFEIELEGVHATSGEGDSYGSYAAYAQGKGLHLVYEDVVLNIGPNIREIFAYQDGMRAGKTLYVVRVYVNCDPDNPKFYSRDGVLYNKFGEVVDGFIYWNQD